MRVGFQLGDTQKKSRGYREFHLYYNQVISGIPLFLDLRDER
jgi:hypothetical protein